MFDTRASVESAGAAKSSPRFSGCLRVVTLCEGGIRYEADPRHAEIIIEALDLTEAKPVSTPGSDDDSGVKGEERELEGTELTKYRAVAARCNYLSIDRPDIQFVSRRRVGR